MLFSTAFFLAAAIWIWHAYLRRYKGFVKWLHWLPFVVLAGAVIAGRASTAGWYVMTAAVTAVLIPQGVFALFSVLGRIAGHFSRSAVRPFDMVGLAASAAVLCLAVYGLCFGWRHVIVKNVEIPFSGLPESFDGYRIAHISDLHVGTFGIDPEVMSSIVEKVNAQNPDVILFTGDIVNLTPDELAPFVHDLSGLKAADGVYSVLGNHDYLGYVKYDDPREQERRILRLEDMERSAGMALLLNENRILRRGTDSLALVGVENDGLPPFPARGDLSKAQAGLPDGIFKILMSHDPTHWRRKVLPDTDIELTLSGHTHAMQFRVGGFSPSMFIYPEWGGLYSEGERKLYVSTGTGGNIAFRWGAWPEIDIITLRRR